MADKNRLWTSYLAHLGLHGDAPLPHSMTASHLYHGWEDWLLTNGHTQTSTVNKEVLWPQFLQSKGLQGDQPLPAGQSASALYASWEDYLIAHATQVATQGGYADGTTVGAQGDSSLYVIKGGQRYAISLDNAASLGVTLVQGTNPVTGQPNAMVPPNLRMIPLAALQAIPLAGGASASAAPVKLIWPAGWLLQQKGDGRVFQTAAIDGSTNGDAVMMRLVANPAAAAKYFGKDWLHKVHTAPAGTFNQAPIAAAIQLGAAHPITTAAQGWGG